MIRTKIIFLVTLTAFMVLFFGLNDVSASSTPNIITGSADFISPRNVYLNASVNPNGSYTQVWFQIGADNPPLSSRGHQGAGSGISFVNIKAGIINLRIDTTYYYRAVAQNSNGTVYGEIRSFSTSSGSSGSNSNFSSSNYTSYNGNTSSGGYNTTGAPLVTTNGPAYTSANSAVLNGSINPNNLQTQFWFDFGATQDFGQRTSIQTLNAVSSWQLVAGNLSGLENGKTYYYRIVAQNNSGINRGETRSLIASTMNQSSGQILGSTSTSNGSLKNTSSNPSSMAVNTATTKKQANSRPSFISLEYSLNDNGALVLVADDIKPQSGEEFTYTVVYKNDTQYTFSESRLKIIIPPEAQYISSDLEPTKITGNIIEFNLGNIETDGQGAVVISSKIKENVSVGKNLIFTSVLTYKDRANIQLATTSYLTVDIGDRSNASLSASLSGFSFSSIIWLIALGLVGLMGVLTYGLVRVRKRNGNGNGHNVKEDESGLNSIPATFEPALSPMGRPDIFQPVKR